MGTLCAASLFALLGTLFCSAGYQRSFTLEDHQRSQRATKGKLQNRNAQLHSYDGHRRPPGWLYPFSAAPSRSKTNTTTHIQMAHVTPIFPAPTFLCVLVIPRAYCIHPARSSTRHSSAALAQDSWPTSPSLPVSTLCATVTRACGPLSGVRWGSTKVPPAVPLLPAVRPQYHVRAAHIFHLWTVSFCPAPVIGSSVFCGIGFGFGDY